MPARSFIVQLQPGIGQAILPDHRKMLPGVQYVIDWETFEKISNGARQNVIQVVSVQADGVATPNYAAQTSSSNPTFADILNQNYATLADAQLNIAGFAGQGAAGTGLTGTANDNQFYLGATNGLKSLTGPAQERYVLVYCDGGWSAGDVVVWFDESNGIAIKTSSGIAANYVVKEDGQGTPYVVNTVTGEYTQSITPQGGFAGVAVNSTSDGQFSWIQTEGFCPQVNVGSSVVAAGNALSVDTSNFGQAKAQPATAVVVASNNTVTGSALANNTFGTALTATSAGFVQADIRSVSKVKKPYNRFLNKN